MYEDSVDYMLGGTLTLKNGLIDKYYFEDGYCKIEKLSDNSGESIRYYYYDQDHLGNIRQVTEVDENCIAKVVQINNYYPFGMQYCDGTVDDFDQNHKYNGKEYDKMHGLNTYDYGARQYNPVTARWDRIDPLCEKYYGVSPYVYCLNNPIKFLDDQGEEPTAYEAAIMAKHVYGDEVELVGDWKKCTEQDIAFNSKNGLKSALYERTRNGITEYAYVTAGTQDITDFIEDFLQLDGNSNQYRESVLNALSLNEKYSKSELTFVGHSLGGGLAAANALATDRNAITFNPAAVTDLTMKNLHLRQSTTKGLIFNYVVRGEIVSYLQSKVGLKAVGGTYYLNAKYNFGDVINTVLRIKNHLIDTVIKILEEEKK